MSPRSTWTSGWPGTRRRRGRPERPGAALRRFARTFRAARPRAWLYEGLAAHHVGRTRQAVTAWNTSLHAAERLGMRYEQGRAHYELGRHLPPGDPDRQEHLRCAGELFAGIGATYDLSLLPWLPRVLVSVRQKGRSTRLPVPVTISTSLTRVAVWTPSHICSRHRWCIAGRRHRSGRRRGRKSCSRSRPSIGSRPALWPRRRTPRPRTLARGHG